MRGEQAIFNLEIKKKSGSSINSDIHHSKVFSSDQLIWISTVETSNFVFNPLLLDIIFPNTCNKDTFNITNTDTRLYRLD